MLYILVYDIYSYLISRLYTRIIVYMFELIHLHTQEIYVDWQIYAIDCVCREIN